MTPFTKEELIRFAWHDPRSRFYRDFWPQRGFHPDIHFQSDSDWARIPIVQKNDFAKKTLRERADEIGDAYLFAVASTGTGKTTVHPFLSVQTESVIPHYYEFITERCRYSAAMVLRNPLSAILTFSAFSKYFRPKTILAEGDVHNLKHSAAVARELCMDHLVTTPTLAVKFAEELSRQRYSPFRVTFLSLGGEPITREMRILLSRLYPNALILFGYGMSEGNTTLGYSSSSCMNLAALSPNAYHLNCRDGVFEAIDGSLVVSLLHPMPLPLIRFDTGDRVILRDNFACDCGFPPGPVGIIGSRADLESYKIGSLAFRKKDVVDAIARFERVLTGDFLLSLEQVREGKEICIVPALTVRPRDSFLGTLYADSLFAKTFREKIASACADSFWVRPNDSLAAAIQNGYAKPVAVTFDRALIGMHILPPKEIREPFSE